MVMLGDRTDILRVPGVVGMPIAPSPDMPGDKGGQWLPPRGPHCHGGVSTSASCVGSEVETGKTAGERISKSMEAHLVSMILNLKTPGRS
jgi:hypothetical protein